MWSYSRKYGIITKQPNRLKTNHTALFRDAAILTCTDLREAVINILVYFSCRFLLGGDQGRLKYGPAANFAALYEVRECVLLNRF